MNYVVRDKAGAYHVVGAVGFIPEGMVCPAPADAGPEDGPLIDFDGKTATINASRKAARDLAIANAKAAQAAADADLKSDVDQVRAALGKEISDSEMKALFKRLLKVVAGKL